MFLNEFASVAAGAREAAQAARNEVADAGQNMRGLALSIFEAQNARPLNLPGQRRPAQLGSLAEGNSPNVPDAGGQHQLYAERADREQAG